MRHFVRVRFLHISVLDPLDAAVRLWPLLKALLQTISSFCLEELSIAFTETIPNQGDGRLPEGPDVLLGNADVLEAALKKAPFAGITTLSFAITYHWPRHIKHDLLDPVHARFSALRTEEVLRRKLPNLSSIAKLVVTAQHTI